MKKLLIFVAFSFIGLLSEQEAATPELEKNVKLEIGTRGLSGNVELPLSKSLMFDLGLGYGFVNTFNTDAGDAGDGIAQIYLNHLSPFAIAKVDYFLSRDRRFQKNRKMHNNSGSFIAYQLKYNPNQFNKEFGQVLMNELHFGQQLAFDRNLSFNYHLGVGYALNLQNSLKKFNVLYPALGASLSYYFK